MSLPTSGIQKTDKAKTIECRSVWKLFGGKSSVALERARRDGLDREQVIEEFGSVLAVADASFDVREGETFCIIGLSGSGKSTLIRHFNRLIAPSAGEVIVRGQDVCKLNAVDLRQLRSRHISMVFQHVALLSYKTVLQNVELPLEVRGVSRQQRREACRSALETVGLKNWTERYPSELSGGMQQRVGIARALAADSEILLMDEPFSALDPLIRKQLQIEFKQLSTKLGKTSIFITHDLEEAIRIGDRIAIMKEGRIVQIGTPEEIVLNPADDYVAEFVEGISRLHLVKAGSIMRPCGQRAVSSGAPEAFISDDLQTLIDIALQRNAQEVAIVRDGQAVGAVSRETLLKAVRGIDAG